MSAFHPCYRMTEPPPTPPATLQRAREIGLETGLSFVYQGNIPGQGGEDTLCPGCGALLIQRIGYTIRDNRLGRNGDCPDCGRRIAGVWA